MKKIFFALIIMLTAAAAVFAGYKEEIASGNKAYKAEAWKTASVHYRLAYAEQPSAKLKKLIVFVEAKLKAQAENETAAESDPSPQAESRQEKTPAAEEKPFNWAAAGLITLDIVLAGGAAYLVYDQQKAQDDYLKFYSEANNTTDENYKLLVEKQKSAYDKMTLEVVALSAAGIAIVLTLGDLLFSHEIFTADVAVMPVLAPGYAGISAKRSF